MYKFLTVNRLNQADLIIYQYGTQECYSDHSWGPGIRDHFLFHFIHSGKGIFQYNGIIHNLEKGQAFLIHPNVVSFYQADSEDPWSYSWIGFHGLRAEQYIKQTNLTPMNPIFSHDDYLNNAFKIINAHEAPESSSLKVLGFLYVILSRLIGDNETEGTRTNTDKKEQYIRKVMEYVDMNYSKKILISDMADYVGLDRSYLCSIFKNHMNTTLKKFLINLRINKACELMGNEALSIGDISRSVGYEDPLQFSKAFKSIIKMCPVNYRKKCVRKIYPDLDNIYS